MKDFLFSLITNNGVTEPVTLPTGTYAAVFVFPPNSIYGSKLLPGTYEIKGNVISFNIPFEGTLDVIYG